MPGPVGIISREADLRELREATDLLMHAESYSAAEAMCADGINAGIVYRKTQKEKYFQQQGNLSCWFEGEIYNLTELQKIIGASAVSFPLMLLQAHLDGQLERLLAKTDGCFSAVIFDGGKMQVKLISDRLGMTPLYLWSVDGNFAWAPEIKSFTVFRGFKKELRKDALECFMDLGQLLGDITWFKNVSMLDAATVLTFDIRSAQVTKMRYWKWSSIPRNKIPFKDAVQQLGDLIKKSVRSRFDPAVQTGLSLSGGLDSRAVLASLINPSDVYVYTFGANGSAEIEIASRVCRVLNVPHHVFILNEKNWMDGRLNGVWRSDGMYNLKHMHATPFLHQLSGEMLTNLNGFIGDPGNFGSWVTNPEGRISAYAARKKFGRHYLLSPPEDDFFDIPYEQPYYIHNRVRRFTNAGVTEASLFFTQQRPFISNNLIDFSYSLPPAYRKNNRLYTSVLLHHFPHLYENIPRAYSRHSVGAGRTEILLSRITEKFSRRKDMPSFNYAAWLREKNTAALFNRMLDVKNAIYPEILKEDFLSSLFIPHQQHNADHSERLCRIFTLELWLQQIYNNKYRDPTAI